MESLTRRVLIPPTNDANLAYLSALVNRYGADVILRGNSPHLHCCPYHGVCLLGRDLPCRLGSVVNRLSLSPCLVPDVGFEPTALALQKPCSTTELIRQLVLGGVCQARSHTPISHGELAYRVQDRHRYRAVAPNFGQQGWICTTISSVTGAIYFLNYLAETWLRTVGIEPTLLAWKAGF